MKTAASVTTIYTLVITVAHRKQYSHGKNIYCNDKNKMFTTQTNILTAQTKTLAAEVNLTAEMIFASSGYLVSLTKYGGILSFRCLPTQSRHRIDKILGTL